MSCVRLQLEVANFVCCFGEKAVLVHLLDEARPPGVLWKVRS